MMSNNNNPELKTWFDDAIKQGHTIDELIPHLKEHGYTDEMINPVVDELKAELEQNTTILNEENNNTPVENPDSNQDQENQDVYTSVKVTEHSDDKEELIQEEDQNLDSDELEEDNQEEVLDDIYDQNNNLENQDSVNVIDNSIDTEEVIDEENNQNNEESNEMTLEEIEKELEAGSLETEKQKSSNLIKPIISIVALIAILLAGYAIYPKVVDIISNFSQGTPKAAPPTLPGNNFETNENIQDNFVKEDSSQPTSLNETIQDQPSGDEQKLRRFKKELYFN